MRLNLDGPKIEDPAKHLVLSLALLVAGGLIATVALALIRPPFTSRLHVRKIRAITSLVNSTVTAIGVEPESNAGTGGFDVSGAVGRDCLVPSSSGQHIELGVIRAPLAEGDTSRDFVLWVVCLSQPETHR